MAGQPTPRNQSFNPPSPWQPLFILFKSNAVFLFVIYFFNDYKNVRYVALTL